MSKHVVKIKDIVNRFRDLTTLGVANILSAGISGVFWFYLASLLGTSQYGKLSYLTSIGTIGGVISFLGAGTTITVYSAKNEKIQATLFSIVIITSAIGSIVSFLIVHDYTVSLYIIGYGIFNVSVADILGKKQYKDYSKYLVIQKLLWVCLALLFYYIIGFEGIILGIALSFLAYSFVIIRGLRETKFSVSMLKNHFAVMMNNYVLDLSRAFGGNIDKLIIAPLLGFSLLGNYQLGQQFLALLSLVPNIVFQYLLPHDSSGNANKKLKKYLILFSILLAGIGITASPFVIPHLFPKYTEAVRIFQIISIAVIPTSISLTYVSQFLGREQSKIVLIGSGISLVVAIPSIILLGKIYGINGATVAIVLAGFVETGYLAYMDRVINKKSNANLITQTSIDSNIVNQHEEKILSSKGVIATITIVVLVGIFLRIYYFPRDIPLVLDALQYFHYASDVVISGHLPTSYTFANNGWPIFLSFFFTFTHFTNTIDYMNLQRALTVFISIATIIPVYFLCKRFFSTTYALIGAAIFAFEPRLIQNSELGITDSLYIALVTLSLLFFFSSKNKVVYSSFVLVSLASVVRAEGLFVFIPLFIMFFVRNRKEKKIILKCLIVISIFVLTLLPMVTYRIHAIGNDAIASRVLDGTNDIKTSMNQIGFFNYLESSLENIVKLSGWSLIPIWIFILLPGTYFILKKRDLQKNAVIIITIFMMLPVFYAYSENADTRYIFPLFPLFTIISLFSIKHLIQHKKNKKILTLLIIVALFTTSSVFLNFKEINYQHQEEAFHIAKDVTQAAKGVNDYYPEDSFIAPAMLPEKWSSLESQNYNVTIIPTKGHTSLSEYIKSGKEMGLTHLVIDDNKNRPDFLIDVFKHEDKYPYLEKIFDSNEYGYKYHVKIFKIDYLKFDSTLQ